jgi:hypothetical protein
MFVRQAPQAIRQASGSLIQIASRDRVELIEPDGSLVLVEAEFGPVSAIHSDSIKKVSPDGRDSTLTAAEKVTLLARIKEGLEAMGGVYELA